PTAQGIRPGRRNTPGLLDARYRRWFGWDGASDSLWAASLRPVLAAGEMGGGIDRLAALIAGDPVYRADYTALFGTAPERQPAEAVAIAAAKALAAFQETLVSPRTPFDDFRDALAAGDAAAQAHYPAAARRGLKLFVGRGDCATCHYGPGFSNGAFADIGRPHFLPDGSVDPGRHGGIAALRASPYTRIGPWSDDRDGPAAVAVAVRHLAPHPRNWGEFKVPSLRGLAATAPYMHDGSLPSLESVLRHYSEVDEERLHADREKLVRPLRLTAAEIADLAAFLATLSPQ
ncbi:MAG: cytochrome-c peroxidase, partial [Alphaproteobacteria bacterium]